MKRRYIGLAMGAVMAVGAALSLPGCGHDLQLVSVTVIPNGATITGTGVTVNFQATGTYIHPPETRNITDSVVWASAAPQIISINANTGVAVSGDACGSNITITATAYSDPQTQSGSAVIGQALVSVTQTACP